MSSWTIPAPLTDDDLSWEDIRRWRDGVFQGAITLVETGALTDQILDQYIAAIRELISFADLPWVRADSFLNRIISSACDQVGQFATRVDHNDQRWPGEIVADRTISHSVSVIQDAIILKASARVHGSPLSHRNQQAVRLHLNLSLYIRSVSRNELEEAMNKITEELQFEGLIVSIIQIGSDIDSVSAQQLVNIVEAVIAGAPPSWIIAQL